MGAALDFSLVSYYNFPNIFIWEILSSMDEQIYDTNIEEIEDMRKIGILTGGGDCPGLNAVIRGVVEKCTEAGIEVFGFRDGWRGAMRAQGRWLTPSEVEGIQTMGGTIIGSSRTNVMADPNGPETRREESRRSVCQGRQHHLSPARYQDPSGYQRRHRRRRYPGRCERAPQEGH